MTNYIPSWYAHRSTVCPILASWLASATETRYTIAAHKPTTQLSARRIGLPVLPVQGAIVENAAEVDLYSVVQVYTATRL